MRKSAEKTERVEASRDLWVFEQLPLLAVMRVVRRLHSQRPSHSQRLFRQYRSRSRLSAEQQRAAAEAYYNGSAPLMSDALYDALSSSRAAVVGAPPSSSSSTAQHVTPMLSLQAVRRPPLLESFRLRCLQTASTSNNDDDVRFAVELKYDGMALALRYCAVSRALLSAATRGDGHTGELISPSTLRALLPSLPSHLPSHVPLPPASTVLEVRGELCLSLPEFRRLEQRTALYRSPRNAVAGLLRNETPPECQLSFIAYGLPGPAVSHSERVQLMKQLQFQTCAFGEGNLTWDQVMERVERWRTMQNRAEQVQFETDGLVIKVESHELAEAMGSTRHHPRHMIAYKWSQSQLNSTVLEAIEWGVDQAGNLRPVAIVQPVDMGTAIVTRASLHNWAFVKRHGVQPGMSVELERVGGVIPKVVFEEDGGDGTARACADVKPPEHCPCPVGARVEENPPLHIRCTNPACPDRAAYRAYVLGTVLGISGLGHGTALQLARAGMLDTSDVWAALRLNSAEKLQELEGWGKLRSEALIKSIRSACSEASFVTALQALGIAGIGQAVWGSVAQKFPSLSAICSASVDDLMAINGIGEASAKAIVDGLAELGGFVKLHENFVAFGLPVEDKALHAQHALPLFGETICITGTLSVSRSDAAKRYRELGAKISNSVTLATSMLVVGSNATAEKVQKAQKLKRVAVVSEEQLEERLRENVQKTDG